ncbi:MAG: serine hydrolase domain-containing protein, partial [Bacteroidota bacterium]
GFSVVVTDKIEVVFSASYGFTEVGGTKPFTAQTVNPVGSLTKSITALAIMQLMEAGKIHLDHPVKHYIPEFTTANPSKSDHVTVRMLLSNTAGLSADVAPTYDISESSVEHLTKTLSNTFILTNPGEVYQYSNLGFSIAGLLISRVSGQPYAEYVRDNIFAPLNMRRSWVLPPATTSSSTDHYPGIDRVITDQSEEIRSGEFVAAGQYTQSTTADLANYLGLYLNSGLFNNKRVVADSLIHQMWDPQIDFPGLSLDEGGDGQRYQYGLGWMISKIDGRKIIHHGGSTGTASSFTMIDPENGLAASLLTNVDLTLIDRYQYAFGLTIVNNVLHLAARSSTTNFASPTKPDPTLNQYQLSENRFANYTGVYRHKSGGDHFVYFGNPSLEISEVGNELKGTVYRTGQVINEFKLDFVNPSLAVTRNVASPTYLRFQLGRSGKVNSAYCFGMELSKADNRQNTEATSYQFELLTFSLPSQWESLPTQGGVKFSSPEGLLIEINNDSEKEL